MNAVKNGKSNIATQTINHLRTLSYRRSDGIVSADDAQNFLSKKGFKGNAYDRLSVVNTVFKSDVFAPVGSTPSKREAAKGRRITTWFAK